MQPVSTSYQPLTTCFASTLPTANHTCHTDSVEADTVEAGQWDWDLELTLLQIVPYNAVLSLLSLKEVLTLDAHRGGTGRHCTWGKQLRLQAQKREH